MSRPGYLLQPIVQRLPVILQEIEDRELLIPRFQRPFVWNNEQRLTLLDSIEKGMPIGSLLVWRTADHKLATYNELGPFTLNSPKKREIRTYLLDGHQRLSTLYGAFHSPTPGLEVSEDDRRVRWPIFYDLERRGFRLPLGRSEPITWLKLSILFRPDDLYEFQKKLFDANRRDLAKDAESLANQFKDYQIPVIPLVTEELNQVTESFQRVNSQGSPMSEVHMVNALMWTKEFDLMKRLERVLRELEPLGWGEIDLQALLGVIKAAHGLDIYTAEPKEVMRTLKENPDSLDELPEYIEHAATFLRERCGVNGPATLPFQYQLVILANAVRKNGGELNGKVADRLERWFWLTTYTSSFSGNTSTQIRRAIEHVEAIVDGAVKPAPPDLPSEVTPARRFDFNSARGRAMALQLARRNPLSSDGTSLDAAELLGREGVRAIPKIRTGQPVSPRSASRSGSRYEGFENRWIATRKQAKDLGAMLEAPDSPLKRRVLQSHAILPRMLKAYARGDFDAFLAERRKVLLEEEKEFVSALGLTYVA